MSIGDWMAYFSFISSAHNCPGYLHCQDSATMFIKFSSYLLLKSMLEYGSRRLSIVAHMHISVYTPHNGEKDPHHSPSCTQACFWIWFFHQAITNFATLFEAIYLDFAVFFPV